jgi:ergothioneine biosynthesis protein EgtB
MRVRSGLDPMLPSRNSSDLLACDGSAGDLTMHYACVRQRSLMLAAALSDEDCGAQSMPDASPLKWHLAHTTWFFETFLLELMEPGFQPFHPAFRVLFNSYYNGIGEKHPRAQRGLLTRPGMAQVRAYRADVDARMVKLLGCAFDRASAPELGAQGASPALLRLLTLGLQHEQQHQELMLTDVKHLLAQSALLPAYLDAPLTPAPKAPPQSWISFDGGLTNIGYASGVQTGGNAGSAGFCFDNELPRHLEYVAPFTLAARLVTNREFLEFIDAGGYRNPGLWLAEGWDWVVGSDLAHPLYWRMEGAGRWCEFTLQGLQALDLDRPACHLSLFEADAYAHWAGARLPTEAEWECAAQQRGDRADGAAEARPEAQADDAADAVPDRAGHLHPGGAVRHGRLTQMFGQCWQWTRSSYAPYPGYQAAAGALGEYNGKFMLNQYVLRGSSCATPPGHARVSYRNFFPAAARWQFTGIRLTR